MHKPPARNPTKKRFDRVGTLDNKVAIVTGAGRGIGRAIARKLASAGARIIANDLDVAPLDQTVSQLRHEAGEVHAQPGDITDPGMGDALVDTALSRFGDLHIVVNNAGYIWNSAAIRHSDEQWQAMFEVHASGPFRLLRAAGRYFREQSKTDDNQATRKVVNVSSVSGIHGAATQLAYSTAKAAVVGMTRTLAKEWGHYNVTVNCVAFGYIETRLTQSFDHKPESIMVNGREHPVGVDREHVAAIKNATPMKRVGTPEDAAGAVYLFCVPESDFITGEVIVASGGLAEPDMLSS